MVICYSCNRTLIYPLLPEKPVFLEEPSFLSPANGSSEASLLSPIWGPLLFFFSNVLLINTSSSWDFLELCSCYLRLKILIGGSSPPLHPRFPAALGALCFSLIKTLLACCLCVWGVHSLTAVNKNTDSGIIFWGALPGSDPIHLHSGDLQQQSHGMASPAPAFVTALWNWLTSSSSWWKYFLTIAILVISILLFGPCTISHISHFITSWLKAINLQTVKK